MLHERCLAYMFIRKHQQWSDSKMNGTTNNAFNFLNQENGYKETSLWYKVIKKGTHTHFTFCVNEFMKNVKQKCISHR